MKIKCKKVEEKTGLTSRQKEDKENIHIPRQKEDKENIHVNNNNNLLSPRRKDTTKVVVPKNSEKDPYLN